MSKVGTHGQVERLSNIVIIRGEHFETVLYVFKVYRTVMYSLKFSTSQIITLHYNYNNVK